MITPPISRMGGKSHLRKLIISQIPDHICYVEPFFGAGWVYFGKEKSKVEVINDLDKEVINLFKILKYHTEEVQRLLRYEVVSRDIFNEYINMSIDNMTDVQRAVRYIYIISNSFASKGQSFGYGALSRPKQKIFEEKKLEIIRDRLTNTYIEDRDAVEIIRKYDRKSTFFFIDPPYYNTSGYSVKFNEREHIKLAECLKGLEGKFLLTLNDDKFVRKLYEDFNIQETEVNYSVSRQANSRKKYKELIIRNY